MHVADFDFDLPDALIAQFPPAVRGGSRLLHVEACGGKVELLVERVLDERDALAFIRASHAPKPGSRIRLADDAVVEVLARQDDLTRVASLMALKRTPPFMHFH
jgi:S-adenosylmethionine:tRNA ribosyltransferase-isomerase